MKRTFKLGCAGVLATAVAFVVGCGGSKPDGGSNGGAPKTKDKYTLAVSIYAGWMPWYYAKESGIAQRWADRYGIDLDIVYMDYIPSVNAFVAKEADACVMTNMEALDMPCPAGIDTTSVIVGDYSNGNDKILVRGIPDVAHLKGTEIYIVEGSVSHYLLARAMEAAGVEESEVKLLNTTDATIGPAFIANKNAQAVVTWNPIAMQVQQQPGVTSIFDSSKIPGEILDLCVVNTKILRDDPRLGDVLVGIWYEVLEIMQGKDQKTEEALTSMAKLSGCPLADYTAQLKTTYMFGDPKSAIEYTTGAEFKQKMDLVRKFCFAHKLLGENAPSVDVVGILYPDGTVQGDEGKIRLRYETKFMQKALDGQLK
jgi:NitT/TauT family transport system substrate-binding protein